PVEATSEMEHRLHADLRRVLRGRFEIDVQSSTDEQVRAAATTFVRRQRDAVERGLLDALAAGQGTGLAVAGLAETLDALLQARVRSLLLTPRHERLGPARCCPTCDWLGAEGTTCPVDGTELRTVDAAELVTTRALAQDAEVVVFRDPESLEPHHDVAAVLRL